MNFKNETGKPMMNEANGCRVLKKTKHETVSSIPQILFPSIGSLGWTKKENSDNYSSAEQFAIGFYCWLWLFAEAVSRYKVKTS